jgi:Ca2+-transporting ATPase
MTGDGVNDAPSIKNADIGVGMGITGTDVTKNVADMILADDNFATIVSAVGEGRRIYDNIKKAIQFLLASNLSEVLTILIATLILPSDVAIFAPIHLLFINLVTDSLPALALGMEKPEADIMKRKPRKSGEGVFADGMGFAIAYQGALVTAITLVSYFIGTKLLAPHYGVTDAPTINMLGTSMAFLTLAMAEIFHAFNMRSLKGSIFTIKKQNLWLIGAGILSFLLTTAVVELLPDVFNLYHLNLTEYLIAIGLAILTIPVVEAVKFFQRLFAKRRK